MNTMTEQEFEELKLLVGNLAKKAGLHEAHDWDGVLSTKDMIIYLSALLRQLPEKPLSGTYRVVCSNGIYLETNDLKRNLMILIENELDIPNRESDLAALLKIRKIVTESTGVIDDTEEDIKMRLYEYRAEVLKIVLTHVHGLEAIITEGNMVKLVTIHPFDEDMVDEINRQIEEKLDVSMDYVMLPVVHHPGDNNVIYWPWKG